MIRDFGRLVFIVVTVLRFGLDEVALSAFRQASVRALVRLVTLGRRYDSPPGVRLRQGLERLGPIFVRGDGPEPGKKVLSWLPGKGTNRRIDAIKALAVVGGGEAHA